MANADTNSAALLNFTIDFGVEVKTWEVPNVGAAVRWANSQSATLRELGVRGFNIKTAAGKFEARLTRRRDGRFTVSF